MPSRPRALSDPPPFPPSIASAWVKGIVRLFESVGLDVPALFRDAGLDLAERTARWRGVLAESDWPVFVAEAGGRVAGFCHVRSTRDDDLDPGTVAEITTLYVEPASWRRGLGRELLVAATSEARRRGFAALVLWVLEANAGARRFYEALGLATDGRSKIDGRTGLSEVRYRRSLVS